MNSRTSTELLIPREWRDRQTTSPERAKVWTEEGKFGNRKSVSVVYFISRNGHLEQPHFMEVPLSSPQGLCLRDVMNRLNFLRGEGMADTYSWSSKRSYKNGFVWQDLSEDDLIHPTHGCEYVLKGSELLRSSLSFRHCESTGSSETLQLAQISVDGCDFPATARRRNQSWSSFEKSHEHRVYKVEQNRELAGKAAHASTQTGDERRREESGGEEKEQCGETATELSGAGASPAGSNSSSEPLAGVSGLRAVDQSPAMVDQTVRNEHPSGRAKASRVLKQLVTCGHASVSLKDYESMDGACTLMAEHQ